MAQEELSYKGPDGCVASGQRRKVVASASASVLLTAEDSGNVMLLDRATTTYTLPAVPVAGMTYTFMGTIAATAHTVTASVTSGAIFLLGSVQATVDTAATGEAHLANGTSHVGIALVSAETGGLIGSVFTVTALSATIWNITGQLPASGTMTTPFVT
jgi:hypothetical protein